MRIIHCFLDSVRPQWSKAFLSDSKIFFFFKEVGLERANGRKIQDKSPRQNTGTHQGNLRGGRLKAVRIKETEMDPQEFRSLEIPTFKPKID